MELKNFEFSYTSEPILTINNKFNMKMLNLNPDFQRGYIWKREFKDELIVSILNNYPIGNIIFHKKNKFNVVDGKQRLNTIFSFLNDKEPYIISGKKSVERIKEIIDAYKKQYHNILTDEDNNKIEKILNSRRIVFRDFPTLIQDNFKSYNLNVTTITSDDENLVAEYFKFVQNQETLKAGEIINSIYIYNEDLNSEIREASNKIDFINFFNYQQKRFEFDKLLINFIGLLSKKINLNSSSKLIVDFAKDYESVENYQISRLLKNINVFTELCTSDDFADVTFNHKGTLRILKIVLSYLSFYELNTNIFISLINTLNNIEENIYQEEVVKSVSFIESRSRNLIDIKTSADNLEDLRIKTNV